MPLTDLARLLNAHADSPYAGERFAHRFSNPFVATERGVDVVFADLRLRSRFLPIVATTSGQQHGHAATLDVTGIASGRPLDPASVFVFPANDSEFVYLDRLVRTLHALNYLTQRVRGNLLLKVHPRHVLSVPADHGLAFEEVLRECGLLPEQVTLEIDSEGVEDTAHLRRAVANYKSRGYGIAIARFGHAGIDFSLLSALQPNIVKLAPALLGSSRPLRRLITRIHELGAQVMVEGVETTALRRGAAENDIDLLQSVGTLTHVDDAAAATSTISAPVAAVRSSSFTADGTPAPVRRWLHFQPTTAAERHRDKALAVAGSE